MKKTIVLVIIAIVGLGVGLAAGIIITNSKSKAAIADMQSKMQQSEASSQERINSYNRIVTQLNNELQQAKIQIEQLKTPPPAEVPAEAAAMAETNAEPADGPPTGTALYTIKSGDSLWTIAKNQLGNGERFKEILKLNPRITEKSTLAVGSKLILPAK